MFSFQNLLQITLTFLLYPRLAAMDICCCCPAFLLANTHSGLHMLVSFRKLEVAGYFFFLFLIVWVISRGEGGNAQFPSYFETGDFKKGLKI